MSEKYDSILLLNEEDSPIIVESECEELKPIFKDFIGSWVDSKDQPTEVWLSAKLQEYLLLLTETGKWYGDINQSIARTQKQRSPLLRKAIIAANASLFQRGRRVSFLLKQIQ